MYCIKHFGPSVLKAGKKFVVCDAGGGTVDLISYEVSNASHRVVREVTEGTGGRCGSAMLNKRFRRLLKQTHGERYWTNERLVLAISEFESVSGFAAESVTTLMLKPGLVQKRLHAQRRVSLDPSR